MNASQAFSDHCRGSPIRRPILDAPGGPQPHRVLIDFRYRNSDIGFAGRESWFRGDCGKGVSGAVKVRGDALLLPSQPKAGNPHWQTPGDLRTAAMQPIDIAGLTTNEGYNINELPQVNPARLYVAYLQLASASGTRQPLTVCRHPVYLHARCQGLGVEMRRPLDERLVRI
jgi:hypothetical protein